MVRKQSGFTLVEIAIVLVVIGLLLGGILKGQQLINSARVRNMADQNSGVQAAYYGFIDRFRQIPGDMPAKMACQAITSDIAGCGGDHSRATIGGDTKSGGKGQNGRIDEWVEAGALWAHLSHAQFLNGTYIGAKTQAEYEKGVSTGAVPGNAFQQPILLGCTDDYEADGDESPAVRLAYVFGGGVTPALLRELDVKLDDGDPGKGIVRATVRTQNTGETAHDNDGQDFGASETIRWSNTKGPDCVNDADSAMPTWNVDSGNTSCNAVFLY